MVAKAQYHNRVTKNFEQQNMQILGQYQQRNFFGSKKEFKEEKDASSESKKEETEKKEEAEAKEEDTKKEAKEEASEEKKKDSSSSSSSDSEVDLSAEDIKKIKALIAEQDGTIEAHEKKIEELETDIKKYRQQLAYQMAENDNTVKRYRKQIEDGKQFAISKFAKELLDVRDNLSLALQHVDLEALEENEDIEMVKTQFKSVVNGQEMTTKIMDKVLGKFDVTQFDPIGEKFDPNIHDAIFMIPEHEEIEDNHVGQVVQTGWKIGERVLRAAKVGIVKK